MDYSVLLKNRRSIREFEDREVDLKIIEEIIKESCLAPSSGNRQEWRFIIINNKELIRKISDVSKRSILKEIDENPDIYYERYKEILKNESFNVFYNAPCLIYILGPKENHTLYIDCSLIACYLMFSATERGLGTCWIGFGGRITDTDLLEEIGVSDDYRVVAPIILGYPRRIPDLPERKNPQILNIIT